MSVGIFGGTFDPVHNGHIEIAKHASDLLNMKVVYFVVSSIPPHKSPRAITNSHHRFAMCAIALNEIPTFKLSTIELENQGSPFTVDTLRKFNALYEETASPLFLILGADSFASIGTWKDHQELITDYNILVVERPNTSVDRVDGLAPGRYQEQVVDLRKRDKDVISYIVRENIMRGIKKTYLLDVGTYAVSSTEIREKIRRNEPVDHLLPAGVFTYIYKQEIYKT